MNKEEWFERESTRLKSEWDAGNYPALVEALRLYCWNNRALPEWVAGVVIAQADEIWTRAAAGKGRLGNWQARYHQNSIHKRRADLVEWHLKARRRRGRSFVSELGAFYGYGIPAPKFGGVNIVTRTDVFEFVSKQLKGTPAQGSSDAMAKSYQNRGKPKRQRSKRKRGGK